MGAGVKVKTRAAVAARPKTRFPYVLAALACVATVYMAITTLIVVCRVYSPLPMTDTWSLWLMYLHAGSYSSVFELHNGHRILITRLVYLIDRYAFHSRNLFPLVCTLLCQAGTGVWLYRIGCRVVEANRLSRLLLACLIVSVLASAQQVSNFASGFQITFTMVYCAACGSILALLHAAARWKEGRDPDWWFAVSCVSALVAAYSAANGLLIWPVLIALGLWLRLPRKFTAAFLLNTILVFGFYLRGFAIPTPQGGRSIGDQLVHWAGVLVRAATFLGAPFDSVRSILAAAFGDASEDGRVIFAAAWGLAGMLLLLAGAALLWRRRSRFTPAQAALLHIAGFVVLSAGMVGVGRDGFPLVATLDSRYTTHGLVFWVAMAILLWSLIGRKPAARRSLWLRITPSAAVLCIILGLAVRQPFWLQHGKNYAAGLGEIRAAMVADVLDEPVWETSFPPSGAAIVEVVDYLRWNHLSVFTEPWTGWVGKPLSMFQQDSPANCAGYFDTAQPIASQIRHGWRVSGWAWDRRRQTGPGIVILADSTGRVAGVVNNPVDREDVLRLMPEVHTVQAGWIGYVAGTAPVVLRAYLLEGDGRSVCSFGAPLMLPADRNTIESPEKQP